MRPPCRYLRSLWCVAACILSAQAHLAKVARRGVVGHAPSLLSHRPVMPRTLFPFRAPAPTNEDSPSIFFPRRPTRRSSSSHSPKQSSLAVRAEAATREGLSETDLKRSVAVLERAVETRDVPANEVLDAIYTLERGVPGPQRRIPKERLDGSWQLVFTTGDVKTQKRAGRQFGYIPFKAVQTFDPKTDPPRITNSVYWGERPVISFSGNYKWLPKRSALKWQFFDVTLFDSWTPEVPADLKSFLGLSKEGDAPPKIGGPFFNWIYVNENIAVARATGVAIWKKTKRVDTRFD